MRKKTTRNTFYPTWESLCLAWKWNNQSNDYFIGECGKRGHGNKCFRGRCRKNQGERYNPHCVHYGNNGYDQRHVRSHGII